MALAARMGRPPDAFTARLLAGVVSTALWALVDRGVAEGADPARMVPMIHEVFDMLASGFETVVG